MNGKKIGLWVLVLNFMLLSVLCFWADSEAWPVKVASLVGDDRQYFDYLVKPVFMLLLRPIVGLSQALGVYHMDLARIAFALNGLAIIYLGQRLLYLLTKSARLASIYAFLLLSSTLYLERGFRVRSDMLASTLIMAALLVSFQSGLTLLSRRIFVAGILLLAAGVTLKSVLVFACCAPVFLVALGYKKSLERREDFHWFLPLWMGLFFVVLGVSLTGASTVQHVWSYGWQTFSGISGGVPIWSPVRFQYVWAFIIENPVLVILILGGGIWSLVSSLRAEQSESRRSSFGIGAALLLGLIAVFPNRLPFFLASVLPLLALFTMAVLPEVRMEKGRRALLWGVVVGLLVHLFIGGYASYRIYSENSNLEQRAFISEYSRYLKLAKNRLAYDPSGLLPNPSIGHFYLGPGQSEENKKVAGLLLGKGYNFLFLGQRMSWLMKEMTPSFLEKTRVFAPGIMMVGDLYRGEIVSGKVDVQEVLLQVRSFQKGTALPVRKVYFKNISPKVSGAERAKIYLKWSGKAIRYEDSQGISIQRLLQMESLILHPKSSQLLIFVQDFPEAKGHSKLKTLMAFDRWL